MWQKCIQFGKKLYTSLGVATLAFQKSWKSIEHLAQTIEPVKKQEALDLKTTAVNQIVHPTTIVEHVSQAKISQQLSKPSFDNDVFWMHVDSFIKSQNSLHTQRAYFKDLEHFLDFIKASNLPMSVHTLVTYRQSLTETVSVKTGKNLSRVSINRKMATLKSFLNWLVLNSVIPNNPARAVKSFRAEKESPTRDIPNDRVRIMLDLPYRGRAAGSMHYAIMMILFHLGLRRSELVGIRTSDLFEQDGMRVIRVRGKGDKERILPLTPDISRSIDQYLMLVKKNPEIDQVLFTATKNNVNSKTGQALNTNSVAHVIKRYAKLAGVRYSVSPHSARATAVSNALDNLAPHRAVQHMAGWNSPLMVTRYDKRKQDLKNSAVKYISYDSVA